ncbi:15226_t:CDS:2 [Funneliformis geosporum]|uniref:12152_t:CDS:1 n=1 Tax=Funneliformis geosporum TaxID=1117311 RepID=A0A9W4X119_9GLOM|nr:15226_t:CDS:2 [Funneliformis geosporum]CAI2187359.1 12152_t:CDS:2 [Funneliformis geosporum]
MPMEPPSTPTTRHTVGDTKKSIHTDILNLVGVLNNYLDLDVKIAKEIKVFSTQVIDRKHMSLHQQNCRLISIQDGSLVNDGRVTGCADKRRNRK